MAAIIIGTHGKLSEALLRSCEMICGPRENIAAVTLEPGESVEGLVEKYQAALRNLDVKDGVLFMTDLLGGSPYNAACRIAMEVDAEADNIGIITGANLPMLLEVLNLGNIKIKEYVEVAQTAGKQGIQVFERLNTNEVEDL
ncbi:MAG: mannose transporter subunit [Firmicutes bacterium]|nr:mannose transporter subunit [Bacillota bacterium]